MLGMHLCAGLVSSTAAQANPETPIISTENAEEVEGFKTKIDGIREVLARDHMKVVFFGRYVQLVELCHRCH